MTWEPQAPEIVAASTRHTVFDVGFLRPALEE
jgi:hypothetical protein